MHVCDNWELVYEFPDAGNGGEFCLLCPASFLAYNSCTTCPAVLDYEPGIHLSSCKCRESLNASGLQSSKQFLDHDVDGKFVKEWVPELGIGLRLRLPMQKD